MAPDHPEGERQDFVKMIATIRHGEKTFRIDFADPLDLSIPVSEAKPGVNAWESQPPRIRANRIGGKKARVDQGATVNFNTIRFNPHSHGTHTECAGHITAEAHSVYQAARPYFFKARLISVAPEKVRGDLVIGRRQLQDALKGDGPEAVVIRTLPNTAEKTTKDYTDTNPAYLSEEAAAYLASMEVQHLLVDLPSVDREKDGGELRAHRAFWNFNGPIRHSATITELIYVPDRVPDGLYVLNLQVAPFENDAAPSRPVLYRTREE